MKKILLLFLFSAISIDAFAQEPLKQKDEAVYIYCEIVGKQRVEFENSKIKPRINWGELVNTSYADKFKGKDGKPIPFNSMTDAMNRMSIDGWEFVQAYVVPSRDFNQYRWVLRRKIDSLTEKEKNEFLLILTP